MKRIADWLESTYINFKHWMESWKPCHKELMGYTCQHRIMHNGRKECGDA